MDDSARVGGTPQAEGSAAGPPDEGGAAGPRTADVSAAGPRTGEGSSTPAAALRVAFLGLGEAGSLIATDLARSGALVSGFDPEVAEAGDVKTVGTPAELAQLATVILSVNSAADALEAAESVAETLTPAHLYADLNTAAPARKQQVAALIEPTGAAFADVALLGPVPGRGLTTPAIASGPGAARFAELFGPRGMPVDTVGPVPGDAAARKLVRSVFWKGMAAAIGEALAAGKELGIEDWLTRDIERTLEEADAGLLRHLVTGSERHAVRRAEEMSAAADMLAGLGLEPRTASAARDWLRELAE